MKKIMTIFVAFLFSSTILTSCGPSICDCFENTMRGADADESKAVKCKEKFDEMTIKERMEELEKCK